MTNTDTDTEMHPTKRVKSPPFWEAADMRLSGARIQVGNLVEKEGEAVFLLTDEAHEPIYMNADEARMLISALTVSIRRLENDW